MKKLFSTTILCFIICGLPLIWQPNLMLHPAFLIIVFFFYLLFFTQPTFNTTDIYKNSATDRFSMGFITLGLVIVLTGSILNWAYYGNGHTQFWNNQTILGLLLLIIGSLIRIWAIRHLGAYFTNAVQFDTDHKLITTGPYKYIRHPSYLGAYLAIVGVPLVLNTSIFFCIGIVVMLGAYLYRIHVEEIGLVQTFSKAYTVYQKQTKRMIPFVY